MKKVVLKEGQEIQDIQGRIYLIEKGDCILMQESDSNDTALQSIADIVRNGVKLVSMRPYLEKLFPKKDIDFSYEGAPHYTIKMGKTGKSIMIVNKKYVDDAELVVEDVAIGYL
jgi:hypothetical protein